MIFSTSLCTPFFSKASFPKVTFATPKPTLKFGCDGILQLIMIGDQTLDWDMFDLRKREIDDHTMSSSNNNDRVTTQKNSPTASPTAILLQDHHLPRQFIVKSNLPVHYFIWCFYSFDPTKCCILKPRIRWNSGNLWLGIKTFFEQICQVMSQ